MQRYDLSKWVYTDRIQIDSSTVSHSHPLLTLNARWVGKDEQALATFLHEQIHWLLASRPHTVDSAIHDLRTLYPDAPKSPPEGARDENSTFLHLVVNYLEYRALSELLGLAEATTVLKERREVFYTWIYARVLDDTDRIGEVVRHHGLER